MSNKSSNEAKQGKDKPVIPNYISGWIVINGQCINLSAFATVDKGVTKTGLPYLSFVSKYDQTEEKRVQLEGVTELDVIYRDIIALLNAPVHDPGNRLDITPLESKEADNVE